VGIGRFDKENIQHSAATATPYQTYTTAYTLSNQVFTVTDPTSNVTTNTYDTLDRLLTTTDAQSRVTTFAYDARSKLYTVKDATNTISETRTYTNNGHLYQLKDARSETTTYSYDGFDRPDKTTYADASYEENVSYDKNGNLLTSRTRSGNTIVNTFDVLNRLATKTPTGEALVTCAYDLHGRLLSATTPVVSGNPATGAFSIAYDTAGRVKSETTPDSKVTQYGLDSNGNLTKLTYPDGYYVTRVFDQLNRLTNIKLNGATASAIGITYDELSRRNVLTYGNGATSTYTFALNEDMTGLAAAFVGSSVTFGYGFNKVHQETSRSVSDGSYMWHPSATATTTYAAANNVNEYPTVGGTAYTYDANANLKTDGTWTYTYDTENHLLSASKTGTSASYVYDPLHRQIQKTVGTTKSRYVYAGWQRIADYDGTAGTLQNRYIYGTGFDEPLVQVSSSGTLTYLHADRQGSIIATTNSSGAVVNELKYGPYGESAALVGTTFGFTGQRYDAETGLYHYKRRQYSSTLGRFLSIDPLLYRDSLNLYAYVVNDPVNKSDALGLGLVDVVLGDPELQQLIEQAAQALLAGLLGASAGAAIGIYFPPNVPAPIVTDNQCPMGRSKRDDEKAKQRYRDRQDQGLKKGDPLEKKDDRSTTHQNKDRSGLDLGGADNIEYDKDGHIIAINGKPVYN
jgi:RHS repeat-associated protein